MQPTRRHRANLTTLGSTVPVTVGNGHMLWEHHCQQAEERLAAGTARNDSGGLVFTSRWCEPIYPDTVTALMT